MPGTMHLCLRRGFIKIAMEGEEKTNSARRSSRAGSSMASADARAAQAAGEAPCMAAAHSLRASLAVFDV